MGFRRVGHDWASSLSLFTFMHWRRKWQPAPVFLLGESQGWGSLVGCRLWGRAESDTTEVTQQQQQPLRINCWSDFYQTSLVAQTVKNLPAKQENCVLSSGEGNGNPLQYSCLENSMGRGAWWAKGHGLQKIRHDWASNPFTYTLFTVFYHHELGLPVLEFYLSFGMILLLLLLITRRNLSLPTRDWTWAVAVEVLSPYHWTLREFIPA